MTNLFSRLKEIIAADLNETLNRKEKQNPIALLNQYLRNSEQEAKEVRKLVERQYLLKDEFSKEFQHALELAKKRQVQGEIASKAGETELYQLAKAEYQQYEDRAKRLNAMIAQASEQLGELEKKYQEMNEKLKDMQLRRMEVMGRENIARANLRIDQRFESSKARI